MTTLYLMEPHTVLKKDGERLMLHFPRDKESGVKKPPKSVPLNKVTQVVVQADATLTTPAMLALLERGVDIAFLSFYGKFRGSLTSGWSNGGELRLAQYRRSVANSPNEALVAARGFVRGKLTNMRVMLVNRNRDLQDEAITLAARELAGVIESVKKLKPDRRPTNPRRPQLDSAWGQLLGLEGRGSACYFGVFGRLLNKAWRFEKRVKRPPTDPVNALLSYGYALLTNQVVSAVSVVGLDPQVGFLHSSSRAKPALALDLMEEFRPLIVDPVVRRVLNKGIIKPTDFVETLGAFRLTDEGRRRFLQQYEQRLGEQVEHPLSKKKYSYRRMIETQARFLARWLRDELPSYEPFVVR